MSTPINRSTSDHNLRSHNLKAAQKRIKEALSIISKNGNNQALFYGLFEDSLMAAGLARSLRQPKNKIYDFLMLAANAALQVYLHQQTVVSNINYLTGEEYCFVDESMINPWVYVQAIYAGLVSNQQGLLKKISNFPPWVKKSKQLTVSPLLEEVSEILRLIVCGDIHYVTVEKFTSFVKKSLEIKHTPDEYYWLVQAVVIEKFLHQDKAETLSAIKKANEYLDQYYSVPELHNDPNRFLMLPILGLTALSDQLY